MGASAERILAGLEMKMGLEPPKGGDLVDRVRKIRAVVHQVRIDPERLAEHRVAAVWSDEAMLALRILGYGKPYVAVNPTLDRYAETVERLNEDLFGRWDPPMGERDALVHVGGPINLGEWTRRAAEAGEKPRQAVGGVTRAIEEAVQLGLDAVNGANEREGSRPY